MLQSFIQKAEDNYTLAINDLVYKPREAISEIVTWETFKKTSLFFTTIRSQVRKTVKHPWLRIITEFPVLFLGATPQNTPAFYNFMNFADFGLGTWHPHGGMYSVIQAMVNVAKSMGVTLLSNQNVEQIIIENNAVVGVKTALREYACDLLLSGVDYAHIETLLPKQYKKTFAPIARMFYVGFDRKLPNFECHTFFFDTDLDTHSRNIYKTKTLPKTPLFYASFPSMTDSSVAPKEKEASIFLLFLIE